MNCSAFEAKDGEEAISVLGHLWPLDIIFMDIEVCAQSLAHCVPFSFCCLIFCGLDS